MNDELNVLAEESGNLVGVSNGVNKKKVFVGLALAGITVTGAILLIKKLRNRKAKKVEVVSEANEENTNE